MAQADAPVFDFTFTVCDKGAGEASPVWPGRPVHAHRGRLDPAAIEGPDIAKESAFAEAFRFLKNRITAFAALSLAGLDALALDSRLHAIGRMDGASSGMKD